MIRWSSEFLTVRRHSHLRGKGPPYPHEGKRASQFPPGGNSPSHLRSKKAASLLGGKELPVLLKSKGATSLLRRQRAIPMQELRAEGDALISKGPAAESHS
ncbi:hypothetical protein Tco_0392555 [Tanacetum coccineum]